MPCTTHRRVSVLLALLLAATTVSSAAQTFDSRDVGVVRGKPADATRMAVVVALGDYEDPRTLPSLRYAEKDARDLAALLEGQGFRVTLMVMKDGARRPETAGAVYSAVEDMCDRADPSDTILFFFSGHGFTTDAEVSYLCMYNARRDDLAGSALAVERLAERMRQSKARKKILIADACRNIPGEKSATADMKLQELEKARGLGILFSTAPGSRSYEPAEGMQDKAGRDIRNGVFTHFLLHGLRGAADGMHSEADEFVTFREAGYWVGKQLKEFEKVEQTPFLRWDGGADEDIWLTRVPARPSIVEGTKPRVEDPPREFKPSEAVATPAKPPEPEVVPLQVKEVTVRIYHAAGSAGGRNVLAQMRERLELEGFRVEVVDLNKKKGMPDRERMQKFVGDQCVFDIKPDADRGVCVPPRASRVVAKLRELFPDKRFNFVERKPESKQRQKEGEAVDKIVDWVGLPQRAGK